MEDAQVAETTEDSSMVYVECGRCKSSIVAVVAMSGMGMVSLGMVTDMNREDVERFRAAPIMSGNELLEMIQLLQRKDRTVVRELTSGPHDG
jgi:hypothetical protein